MKDEFASNTYCRKNVVRKSSVDYAMLRLSNMHYAARTEKFKNSLIPYTA